MQQGLSPLVRLGGSLAFPVWPLLCGLSRVVICTWMLVGLANAEDDGAAPTVLVEAGRDFPETRYFSVCPVRRGPNDAPLLAVGGFTNNGRVDLADLAVYEVSQTALELRWRLFRGSDQSSSIRTLRAADLDRDGCDELIALGRIGDEELDSRAELQVLRADGDHWQLAAAERWQSGQYTHGYGMAVGDLDGDDRAEIVTGGFFADPAAEGREQAELKVWHLDDGRLNVVAATSWGAPLGHTRINAVCVGEVTGDGRPEIVTAGRTGQVQSAPEVNAQEADQIVVWQLGQSQLVRVAIAASPVETRSRIRELKLADIDGRAGQEILAVGRHEPPRGRGDGTGGGRGDGRGGGRGRRGTVAQGSPALRPLFSIYRFGDACLEAVSEADFGDSLGEVRDVAVVVDATGRAQVLTITAHDLKPQRRGVLESWTWSEGSVRRQFRRVADLGDETRARQIVVWAVGDGSRILTIGIVERDGRILGQILDWGSW